MLPGLTRRVVDNGMAPTIGGMMMKPMGYFDDSGMAPFMGKFAGGRMIDDGGMAPMMEPHGGHHLGMGGRFRQDEGLMPGMRLGQYLRPYALNYY